MDIVKKSKISDMLDLVVCRNCGKLVRFLEIYENDVCGDCYLIVNSRVGTGKELYRLTQHEYFIKKYEYKKEGL